jgi:hypothetical protein
MYQGYVSVNAAAELYGVVIDPITREIDRAATQRRRSRSPTLAAKQKMK